MLSWDCPPPVLPFVPPAVALSVAAVPVNVGCVEPESNAVEFAVFPVA